MKNRAASWTMQRGSGGDCDVPSLQNTRYDAPTLKPYGCSD
jgi:hypothetical protein